MCKFLDQKFPTPMPQFQGQNTVTINGDIAATNNQQVTQANSQEMPNNTRLKKKQNTTAEPTLVGTFFAYMNHMGFTTPAQSTMEVENTDAPTQQQTQVDTSLHLQDGYIDKDM